MPKHTALYIANACVEKSRETYLESVVEIVQNITKYYEVGLGEMKEKGKRGKFPMWAMHDQRLTVTQQMQRREEVSRAGE